MLAIRSNSKGLQVTHRRDNPPRQSDPVFALQKRERFNSTRSSCRLNPESKAPIRFQGVTSSSSRGSKQTEFTCGFTARTLAVATVLSTNARVTDENSIWRSMESP